MLTDSSSSCKNRTMSSPLGRTLAPRGELRIKKTVPNNTTIKLTTTTPAMYVVGDRWVGTRLLQHEKYFIAWVSGQEKTGWMWVVCRVT
jgi:hypothetical protein